jgi:natural product precursor
MTGKKLKFEDFRVEKLSKDQLKVVKGGDGEGPIDPNQLKGTGGTP